MSKVRCYQPRGRVGRAPPFQSGATFSPSLRLSLTSDGKSVTFHLNARSGALAQLPAAPSLIALPSLRHAPARPWRTAPTYVHLQPNRSGSTGLDRGRLFPPHLRTRRHDRPIGPADGRVAHRLYGASARRGAQCLAAPAADSSSQTAAHPASAPTTPMRRRGGRQPAGARNPHAGAASAETTPLAKDPAS